MKDGPWWQLDAGRINDLQQDSIVALVKRCRAAHFVDVHVRINGKWEVHQADWIKHMKPRKRPVLARWRDLAWRFRCRWSHLWRRREQDNSAMQKAAPQDMNSSLQSEAIANTPPLRINT